MGTNTGAKVAAAKPKIGGGLYKAPLGTTLPTDASAVLDAAFVSLGPISEDGIKPSRDTKTDKIKEWDGSTLANLLTDESRTFEVLLYGVFDADVQKFINGEDNVTVTPPTSSAGTKIAVTDKGGKPDQCVLVLEMVHGGKKMRKVLPIADPVVTGEEPYAGSGLMGYTVEIEALKDESGSRAYEYSEDTDKTA